MHLSVLNERENMWIIDSGATCHMCNDASLFVKLDNLEKCQEITLGDGHVVKAIGRGDVKTEIRSPNGNRDKSCVLHNALYVPSLSYNLVSVSKATMFGKTVKFNEHGCFIFDENQKPIAAAERVGNLYYLNCVESHKLNSTAVNTDMESKECHLAQGDTNILCVQNLQKLATEDLVHGYDYDESKGIDFL